MRAVLRARMMRCCDDGCVDGVAAASRKDEASEGGKEGAKAWHTSASSIVVRRMRGSRAALSGGQVRLGRC